MNEFRAGFYAWKIALQEDCHQLQFGLAASARMRTSLGCRKLDEKVKVEQNQDWLVNLLAVQRPELTEGRNRLAIHIKVLYRNVRGDPWMKREVIPCNERAYTGAGRAWRLSIPGWTDGWHRG